MLQVAILALLATMVLAGPLSSSNLLLEDPSPSAQASYITACEAADNCETYIDPITGRPSIRFKTGMEPGTDDYTSRLAKSKTKRQSGSLTTSITFDDTTISWGCGIAPATTLGNVSSLCHASGQCIPTDSWSTSAFFGPAPPSGASSSETLTITANGVYPSGMSNDLVQGVQVAMRAKGVITTSTLNFVDFTRPTNGDRPPQKRDDDSCQVAKAPDYIGLGVYSSPNGPLEAFIQVTITLQRPENGFCAKISSITGAIAGAFGPVGADLAAIFGVVSASCSS